MKPTPRCQWWCFFSDGHTRYKRYLHHRARRRGKEKKKQKVNERCQCAAFWHHLNPTLRRIALSELTQTHKNVAKKKKRVKDTKKEKKEVMKYALCVRTSVLYDTSIAPLHSYAQYYRVIKTHNERWEVRTCEHSPKLNLRNNVWMCCGYL